MAYTRKKWSEDDHGRAPITGADMNRIESGIAGNAPTLANIEATGTVTGTGLELMKATNSAGIRLNIINALGIAKSSAIVTGLDASAKAVTAKDIHDAIVELIAADKGKA